ncbi:type II toxin-antitoxin system RelE/ParE family toxin [Rhizobium sp. RAF56]|uniref:type II toxin-antitoxin system RelE/ParE family toxin n=1 Tax=Rhizobium sp. RAF56 TaxID=3233062 RepID=UPI003F9AC65A
MEDIRSVWALIAEDSYERADAFVVELEKRYAALAASPFLGASQFPNYPTLRMFPFRSYIIIYEPLEDTAGIELVRLLHAARDYHRFFDD